jgi:hypothetical protein
MGPMSSLGVPTSGKGLGLRVARGAMWALGRPVSADDEEDIADAASPTPPYSTAAAGIRGAAWRRTPRG